MLNKLRNGVQAGADWQVQLDRLLRQVVLGPQLEDLVEGFVVGHQLFVNVKSFSRLEKHLSVFPV